MSLFSSKTFKFFVLAVFLLTGFVFVRNASAATLDVGTITTCGEMQAAGTYILDNTDSAFSDSGCTLTIMSSGVTIDAGTNNVSFAGVIAADGIDIGDSGIDFAFSGGSLTGAIGLLGYQNNGNYGTVTFAGSAYIEGSGTVTGNVKAASLSFDNYGEILGNLTIETGEDPLIINSFDLGSISGSLTYKDNNFYFEGSMDPGINRFTVIFTSANPVFNLGNTLSSPGFTWIGNASEWSFPNGTPTFNFYGGGTNNGSIVGNVNFYDHTYNDSARTWVSQNNSGSRAWRSITSSADGKKLAATVEGGKIYTSTDYGYSWTERNPEIAYPNMDWRGITSSADGLKLAAVAYSDQKLFTSTDGGANWTLRDTGHTWWSVKSNSDGTKLAGAVSNGQIWTSNDSGQTWQVSASSPTKYWNGLSISEDGQYIAASAYGDKIYVSDDAGDTWNGYESNRNWGDLDASADGSKLVAVVYAGGVYTSIDYGQTWIPTNFNGPNFDGVTMSSDGNKIAVVANNSGDIYTSTDFGVTWLAQGKSGNYFGIASSDDGVRLAVINNGGVIETSANTGFVSGNATFNDDSYNNGLVTGNATFNDASYNADYGTVGGNATFTAEIYTDIYCKQNLGYNCNFNTPNPQLGSVLGDVTFAPLTGSTVTFNSNSSWWGDATNWIFDSATPTWNFYSTSNLSSDLYAPTGIVNFYDNTSTGNLITSDNVNFYDSSRNSLNINGNATFNDNAVNQSGNISGTAIFTGSYYGYNQNSYNGDADPTGTHPQNSSTISQIIFAPIGTSTVTFEVVNNWGSDTSNWWFGTSTPVTPRWIFAGSATNNNVLNLHGGSAYFTVSAVNADQIYTDGGSLLFDQSTQNTGTIYVASSSVLNFYGGSYGAQSNAGTINIASGGTVNFNDNSTNVSNGNITVDVGGVLNFNTPPNELPGSNTNMSSSNYGTISGDATFNHISYNVGSVSGNAYFTADSYSYNGNSGSISPNAGGSVGGNIYFNPISGTTTVTFNIGESGVNDACGGSQCYWNDSTSNYVFGDGNSSVSSVWNFYGNSKNDMYLDVPSNGIINFYDTSYNIGTIVGNAVFRVNSGYTYNDGSNGIIDGNADVYYPADKPIGGTVNGTITYHGYPGFYFNDSVSACDTSTDFTCGAGDGDYDNAQNWWTNDTFQTHAGAVPNGTDDVTVYSNITQASSNSDSQTAWSAVFNDSAQNGINLTVVNGATFNDTSSNTGVINGDALFNGDDSSTVVGTVLGNTITRQYTENATTTRNFTTEGGRDNWILIARNAIVDITNAVYNTSLNLFKTFNGMFVVANGNPHVTPQINIISPTTGTNAKWTPNIDWDDAVVCEYSWDNFTTTQTLNCANNGSDIPRPVNGSDGPVSHTLSVRGTNANTAPGVAEKSINFTYDNTLPIDTDCSANLDEPRLYYTLSGDVVGNCTVTVDTEIRGAGYSVSGNVNAVGKNLVLKNITVGGTVNTSATTVGASAGNLSISSSTVDIITANGASAGNGGNITIATSTTGAVYANGGSTSANNTDGGNGGNITITYSLGNASSTVVSSTGGNSTVCGNGGNGGTVTITDSGDYATPTVTGGTGHSCGGGGGGTSGSAGQGTVAGNPPGYTAPSTPSTPSSPSTPARASSTGGSTNPVNNPFFFGDSKNKFTIPVAEFKPLELAPLPTFGGEGKGSFSFENLFGKFLFDPLTTSIENLKDSNAVSKLLASVGLYNQQDLLLKYKKPYPLPEKLDVVPGWITVEADGKNVPLAIGYIGKSLLVEQATVNASSTITFSVISTSKLPVTVTFNNVKYTFKKVAVSAGIAGANKYSLTVPAQAVGNYTLSVNVAPLDLNLEVVQPKVVAPVKVESIKKQSVWGVLNFWK